MALLVGTRNVFLGFSALLVFVALVLMSCAMTTNVWYYFLAPSPANEPRWIITGPQEDTNITFYQETYGLWTSCVYSPNWRYFTCGLIDWDCNFPNCWTVDGAVGCVKTSVDVLGSCGAFNATRILMCFALLFYLLGTIMIFSAFCSNQVSLPLTGGICAGVGAILNMVGFILHVAKLHYGPTQNGFALKTFYSMGWGQILAITAWPVAAVSSTLGFFAYLGTKQRAQDGWDEEEDYGYDYEDGKQASSDGQEDSADQQYETHPEDESESTDE